MSRSKEIAVAAAISLAVVTYLQRSRKSKDAEGAEECKTSSKSLLDEIKIVDVVKYVSKMVWDLTHPERLNANKRDYVRRLLGMVWPKFFSSDPVLTAGRNSILLMMVLSVVKTYLLNHSSTMVQLFTSLVYKKDMKSFQGLLKNGLILALAGSAASSLYNYHKESLAVLWRHKLSQIIHRYYFTTANYYHVANLPGRAAVRDPNERLAREVWSVSQRLSNIVSLLITAVPPMVWFTFKLWKWRGFKYAMLPHLYLLLAYEGAQRLFPKNIGVLWRNQAMTQGAYFQAVTRVQTHSEAIAALGGDRVEEQIIYKKFGAVSGAASALHTAKSKFQLIFNLAYTYGCRSWISSFIMWPLLRSASAAQGGPSLAESIATVRFSTQLMIEMLVANGQLLTMHATAQHMMGSAKRVCSFIDALQKLESDQKKAKSTLMVEGDNIVFDHVEVFTPTGVHLVKDLSFKLEYGGSLLLTGHNGAGKSSIFRCLGGLWAVPEGTITKPGASEMGLHQDIFYLPQKPYNVLGSLRDQLCYPLDPNDPKVSAKLTPAYLKELLETVDLAHLLEAHSNTAEEMVNWQDVLSLGEQQRLAMARLFYHCPRFAILDECTSAVTNQMERLLYDKCKEMGITYITICHRPALREFHDTNLHLTGDGKGGWVFRDLTKENKALKAKNAAKQQEVKVSDTKHQIEDMHHFKEARDAKYKALFANKKKVIPRRSALSKLFRLIKIMVPGSGIKLLQLFAAIGFRTLCHEGYSYILGCMFQAMVKRDMNVFIKFAVANVLQDLTTAWIEEGVVFLQQRVGVAWHKSLSDYAITRYFKNKNYYNMKSIDKRITDPDQRLTSEIQDLSEHFSAIWGHAITPLIDISWFSWRLYGLLGHAGLKSLYLYVVACWALVKLCMPDHEKLNTKEKKLESEYRFVHTRLKTHAESVAFFGGDKREGEIANQALDKLIHHMNKVRSSNAVFKFVFNSISKDYDNPSALFSVPEMLTRHLQLQYTCSSASSSVSGSDTAASGFYLQSAANRTINAFGKLTNLYEHLSKLLGSATRVSEMFDIMDLMEKSQTAGASPSSEYSSSYIVNAGSSEDRNSLIMEGVDIVTPSGECLASDVSVKCPQHSSLLVTGYNGVGKTSFFRVLAGLWPCHTGRVVSPPEGVFLVPQKVYSVSGTLADQVTYPKHYADRDEELEEKMTQALDMVGIAYLVTRTKGGWDAKKPWEDTLSLGEQQRMGLARLFFHRPTFGILDECTDAVSMDVERDLYIALHKIGVTCVTISKRLALAEFHDQELAFGIPNPNGWSLNEIEHD